METVDGADAIDAADAVHTIDMEDAANEQENVGPVEDKNAGGVIPFTRHARRRSARRNVAPDAVEYVLAHGRLLHRTGAEFYFLGRRDIPPCDRCASWASRLEGTIVIIAASGDVVTIYRNRHGLRPIARKMKYRLFEFERDQRGNDAREEPPPMMTYATA